MALLVWLGVLISSRGEGTVDSAAWRVWLEPKFMHAAVSAPVAGAQRTELVAGQLQDGGLNALGKTDWDVLGVSWADFSVRAKENAAADLATLKPGYVRNRRKVIEYAVLHSERPIVASAILAPKFLNLFQDSLGPKVLVALPNRYTAYVFPALASTYGDYAPMIFRDYRATAFPVSVEVFEFSAEGIKAVGAYEEP
ncbi:hypothetical protein ACXR0O_16495 [Verrucomicrobiota bacterium sgz303538]